MIRCSYERFSETGAYVVGKKITSFLSWEVSQGLFSSHLRYENNLTEVV